MQIEVCGNFFLFELIRNREGVGKLLYICPKIYL